LVTCDDGGLVAGVFTRYNNVALSAGDHYLIETRGAWGSIVRQPMGADTDLTVALLPEWGMRGPTATLAVSTNGQIVGSVPVAVGPAGLTFRYRQNLGGQSVAAYWLAQPQTYLPLVSR
jgi:hypothetical protein